MDQEVGDVEVLGQADRKADPAQRHRNENIQQHQKSAGTEEAAQGTNIGIGAEKDPEIAAELFSRGAQLDHLNCQYELGMLFLQKDGPIARDDKAAFFWFNRAASKGSAPAQRQLAVCYENGTGCDVDLEKALSLYREAARNGDVEARKRLNY